MAIVQQLSKMNEWISASNRFECVNKTTLKSLIWNVNDESPLRYIIRITSKQMFECKKNWLLMDF